MNTVIVGARGDRACFTMPSVSKQSRFSFPFITPSAAKGLLGSIFGKPEFEWCIRRIAIMALGETDVIRVNEVKFPENAEPFVASDNRCQVTMRILRSVDYIMEAYPVVTNPGPSESPNTVQKYLAQFNKRIYGNKPFHRTPCFGLREFTASVYDVGEFPEHGSPDVADFEVPSMFLGWSHGDHQRKDNGPSYPYFRDVQVRNGIVEVPRFVGSELKVGE